MAGAAVHGCVAASVASDMRQLRLDQLLPWCLRRQRSSLRPEQCRGGQTWARQPASIPFLLYSDHAPPGPPAAAPHTTHGRGGLSRPPRDTLSLVCDWRRR